MLMSIYYENAVMRHFSVSKIFDFKSDNIGKSDKMFSIIWLKANKSYTGIKEKNFISKKIHNNWIDMNNYVIMKYKFFWQN